MRPAAAPTSRWSAPSVSVSSLPSSSSTTSPATSPSRSLGPGRSPSSPTSRPAISHASRIVAMRSACSGGVACEKLTRRTSAPARISSTRWSRSLVAGPTVATIFVRRWFTVPAAPRSRGCGSGRRGRVLGRLLRRRAVGLLEALDLRQPPERAREDQARDDREHREEPLARREQLEVEEVADRPRREGERVERAEPGDEREHVATGSRCARGPARARAAG